MKKLPILILLVTHFVWAEELLSHVYQLKYADPKGLVKLLAPYVPQVGGYIQFDEHMKALAITTRKDAFPEIEQILKRFDVPPPAVPNVDVTIYLMSALATPSSSAVPPELEPVVKQLRSTFSYKGYQLLDTELMRVRAGQGVDVSSVVNDAPSIGANKTISQVKFRSASVSTDEKGRAIRIDGLKVGLKIPIMSSEKQYQYIDTGISTDVDIHEGQKVVVGKANMDGSDRASIIVLTAKVVE